jgi:hypothetical protein
VSTTRSSRPTSRAKLAEAIIAEVAAVAEAAYRRGFQQGHEAAGRGDELAFDIYRWRFSMPRSKSPEQLYGGRIVPSMERLRIEAPRLADEIRAAIDQAYGIE